MIDVTPAEAFPPGEFLRDELAARNWTQVEFAQIVGRPPRLVNEIIAGKRGITPETAVEFAAALGTSPQFWMNLDAAYRIYELRRQGPAPERIGREARLRELYPVREMTRRGWIEPSEDAEVLESRVLRFFGIKTLDERPQVACAAFRTSYTQEVTPIQSAWVHRVRQVAAAAASGKYSERLLREMLSRLASLRTEPEEARHAPRMLAECGVRFVVVEPTAASRIDGVCTWIDDNSPVIGLTLRHDRIDNFWFMLRHEIEHVLRGDGKGLAILDSDVQETSGSNELPPAELAANAAAADFCTPHEELRDFLARVGDAPPEERVVLFARRIGIHPGLVVGQVQWNLKRYNFLRKYLVRVRETVIQAAVTDGYGRQPLQASA